MSYQIRYLKCKENYNCYFKSDSLHSLCSLRLYFNRKQYANKFKYILAICSNTQLKTIENVFIPFERKFFCPRKKWSIFARFFSLETYLVTLSLSVSYTNIWTPWHTKRLRPQQRKEENRPENRIETIFASFLAYGNKDWKIGCWSCASEKKIGRIGCHESHSKSVEKDQRSSHHWEFVIWGSSISRHFLYFHLFFNAWNLSKKKSTNCSN